MKPLMMSAGTSSDTGRSTVFECKDVLNYKKISVYTIAEAWQAKLLTGRRMYRQLQTHILTQFSPFQNQIANPRHKLCLIIVGRLQH